MTKPHSDVIIDQVIAKSDDRLQDFSVLVGFITTTVVNLKPDELVNLIKLMIKADYITLDEFVHQFIVP